MTLGRRTNSLLLKLAAGLALALGLALASGTPTASAKLVVGTPKSGATVANTVTIAARLTPRRGERPISARFYVEGKLVGEDAKAPFRTPRNAFFNTNALPAGANHLEISAEYSYRSGGQVRSRTMLRSVRVEVFRPPSQTGASLPTNWMPVFSDDFSSPRASRAKWEHQRDDWIKDGIPYSNLEGAGYLSENAQVADGLMHLKTSRRNAAGFGQSTGSINTHGAFSFRYGYIEARILVPKCAGCWPSFWMLPRADHWPPEIDIIEYFDTAKQVIPYSAVHWRANNRQRERYFSQRLMISDQDNYIGTWHTYGALWTRETVQFYIDGVPGPQFSRPSRIPHLKMYPIIQLAVGRGYHPAAGSTMQVDYVKAWQRRR